MATELTVEINDGPLRELASRCPGKPIDRIVADGVDYGKYQEFGTARFPARPCARPAAEAVLPGFVDAIRANGAHFERTEAAVDLAAHRIERRWKENIVAKNVVDTGAYLNSVHVEKI